MYTFNLFCFGHEMAEDPELNNLLHEFDFELSRKINGKKFEIDFPYDYIFHKKDLYQLLDWIRTDEKTLNSKYPNIKYKINPGNRYGDLPFIEINN